MCYTVKKTCSLYTSHALPPSRSVALVQILLHCSQSVKYSSPYNTSNSSKHCWMLHPMYKAGIIMNFLEIYSLSASSISRFVTLEQMPLHCPQPVEQSNPCFLQEHCLVLHPILHPHLTTSSSSIGAASLSVRTDMYFPPFSYHPQSSGFKWSAFPMDL